MNKTFFRVCNPDTKQGLWYNSDGTFSGLIHNRFDFCANSGLAMDFDPELVGWLSAVPTKEELFTWFTEEDIKKLQFKGWFIYQYEASIVKFYERFRHHVICQKTSTVVKQHLLS